jgi:hypothetical protein
VAVLHGAAGDNSGDCCGFGSSRCAELHRERLDLCLGFCQGGGEICGAGLVVLSLSGDLVELLPEVDGFLGLFLLSSDFTLEGSYQLFRGCERC